MHRALVLPVVGLALLATGCKEKAQLTELCAAPRVGERTFEGGPIAEAAGLLRRAEDAEDTAKSLDTKRAAATAKRDGMAADAKKQRAEAEAMPLDDKEARRKAILEVTAIELDAQKLSEEMSKYQADIDRNTQAAQGHREKALALLKPLLDRHGLGSACRPLLVGPTAAK
jgi:hypothetical protein